MSREAIRGPRPMGIGTPAVESLSSYIDRLAAWHGTVPGQLLHRVLVYLDKEEDAYIGRWHRNPTPIFLGPGLNGFGQGRRWVKVLEAFTGRSDLAPLTTCAWDDLFSPRQLRSPHRRWCVPCLSSTSDPYGQLAWTLGPNVACAVHGCRLEDRCPICDRHVPVVHSRSSILKCPWCAGSLIPTNASKLPIDADQSWTSTQLGRLAALSPAQVSFARPISGPKLRVMAKQRGIVTPSQLACLTGSAKVAVWNWWRQKNGPTLPAALRICRLFNVTLHRALLDDTPKCRGRTRVHQIEIQLSTRRRSRQHDWSVIRENLKNEIARPADEARSLSDICREWDIAPRTMREHETKLCRAVASRYRKRRRAVVDAAGAALRTALREALVDAERSGQPLSQRCISSVLQKPGIFSRSDARRALGEILNNQQAPWPPLITYPSMPR